MTNSAIILAGGSSRRLGLEKGLVQLMNKPLILHVLDNVSPRFKEKIVVISSRTQREKFEPLLKSQAQIVVDQYQTKGPLVGALTGFENVQSEYSLLLPCDTPFVSKQVVELLLDSCTKSNAAIPKWPNGYVEPLQAVYRNNAAIDAAKTALKTRRADLQSMITRLEPVNFVSTVTLRRIDTKLLTFCNINTFNDLKKAELALRARTFLST